MFIESYNSINASAVAGKAERNASRAEQVAKDFEAMFTSMMFKAMRGSGNEDSLIKKNMGEKIFTEMLDSEYAKLSAENGTTGLAALILKEIRRSEGLDSPLMIDDGTISTRRAGRRSSAPYGGTDSAALINRVQSRWESIIKDASERYGVDKCLVTAVIARESAGNPNAISPKGAKGLMQLMDGTARDMGVKFSLSPTENVNGGVKYLKLMLDTFDGDETLALASYNAGPGAVKRFGGVPPYRETREYVRAVLALRDTMRNSANNNADDDNINNVTTVNNVSDVNYDNDIINTNINTNSNAEVIL